MCQPREVPRHPGFGGCSCGCCGCGCGTSFRKFFSAKEELERLEAYKDQLKKELAGLEACIKKLKAK